MDFYLLFKGEPGVPGEPGVSGEPVGNSWDVKNVNIELVISLVKANACIQYAEDRLC